MAPAELPQLVREALAKGDLPRAQELAEDGLRLAREAQDPASEASALEAQVALHVSQGLLSEAVKCAKDSASRFEDSANKESQVRLLHLAAQLSLRHGAPFDKAVACAQAARDAQGSASSVEDQVLVLQTLSQAQLANGSPKQALDSANLARDLSREQDDFLGEAVSLLRIAGAQVRLGDLESALSAASDAQELFREVGDPLAEAGAAGLVVRLQRERQDLSAARLAAETARALLRQTGELAREVAALLLSSQIASLELASGAQPGGGSTAREFYEGKGRNKVLAKAKEAVTLSKRLGSENLMAIARVAHARAKVSNGLLEEAMTEIKEVLPVLVACGDKRAQGSAKMLQANLSVLQGQPDLATAKEALECFQAAGVKHDVALAQSMIARLQKTRAPAAAAGAAAPTPGAASAAANAAATSAAATGGPKPATIDKMQLALPERVKYTITELVAEATNLEGMDGKLQRAAALAKCLRESWNIWRKCEEDRALMETGMTSIASIMLRDRIQAEFPQIPEMDLTFVFDYPTIREMTGFVLTALPDDT
ncbi:Carrier domain-containing protein [Durusdinium trenchii]|uniref:Carrier domain-containing protein n=1 Tax=Durusdinium trenchii TaxID=1381693 RepID=A0ABP0ML15_9DINO